MNSHEDSTVHVDSCSMIHQFPAGGKEGDEKMKIWSIKNPLKLQAEENITLQLLPTKLNIGLMVRLSILLIHENCIHYNYQTCPH